MAQLRRQLLQDQRAGKQYTYVVLDGREGALRPQSMSPEKIRSLTLSDVRRLIVY
jgi:hypothetical protein